MALSLPELDALDRNVLSDAQGRSFKEFRRLLTPRWTRIWLEIAAGYLVLGLVFGGVIFLDRRWPRALPLTVVVGALCFGYAISYVQLFFHEAAHYNLARDRKLNDRLATVFIGWMSGLEINAYRSFHFDHHRLLGTPDDTERSYFDAGNARFLIESLTGIKLLRRLLARSEHVEQKAADAARGKPNARVVLLVGLLLNLAVMGFAFWLRSWSLLLAWPLGMIVVHPTINAIRQMLEHRSFEARSDIDYSKQAHGANTRMFGSGPIASTLGGAGFNRHLLHHWDPQLSYTRFAELEAFLLETEARDVIRRSTTTYAAALSRLMRAP
jgi:fatty acid desaturase